jgi:mono/diheme cytochrome c family protein
MPGCSMRVVVVALVASWTVSVGTVATYQQKGSEPAVDPALVRALMEEGAALFGSDCAACHAAEGGESVGPPMSNNASLASKEHVIKRILEGMPAKGMPPFATSYTDRKIAAVSTFIRGSFENAYSPILEEDVKHVRDETKK